MVSDNHYLLHTQKPRFLAEIYMDTNTGKIVITNVNMIDNDGSRLDLVIKRAMDWLVAYSKNIKL
jgi:hypothetical protein